MVTRRLPAEQRRQQILKCATRIFAQSNFKAATSKQIAAEVGISEAAVFNYFATKKDIFLAIIDHVNARILAGWEQQIAEGGTVSSILRDMGVSYLSAITEHPDELKVQFQAVSEIDDPAIAERLRQHHQSYVDMVQELVTRGVAAGEFPPQTPTRAIAYMFDSLGVFANLMNLLGDKHFDLVQANKILDYLLAPLLHKNSG
ncbi:MAG: TetR/AcrR family transcriptional regulator [Halieaceae bacterium]|jgi:AcrR family transcriptional regulator|nr:TetR/AcrR family transcriptional regulator [Halieaceae bacterium]